MPSKTAARLSSLLLASFILAAPLVAAHPNRPVKEPPLLEKIMRKLRASFSTNESVISVPKP